MSLIVAFDTATSATVAGVLAPGGAVCEARDDPAPGERPRHAQTLLTLCGQALSQAGAGWGDVARIGAGVGPGTFTGLRIGVATARALAQATGAELVAIPTLEALALGAAEPGREVLAVLDARRGEAFVAALTAGGAISSPLAVSPERLGALAGGRIAAGDGAIRYREQLERGGADVPPDGDPRHRVGAGQLTLLAACAAPVPVASLVPDYVRPPDADIRRGGAGGS